MSSRPAGRFKPGQPPTNALDLRGRRFGLLTAIAVESRHRRSLVWSCRCDCGGVRSVTASDLQRGRATHCGCLRRPRTDLTGRRFGHWTVLGRSEGPYAHAHHRNLWLCRCDCGTERPVYSQRLLGGGSTSCGCAKAAKIRATKAATPPEPTRRDPADPARRGPRLIALDGRVFGRWRVVEFAGRDKWGAAIWRVECGVCGYRRVSSGGNLRSGRQPHCRCPKSIRCSAP